MGLNGRNSGKIWLPLTSSSETLERRSAARTIPVGDLDRFPSPLPSPRRGEGENSDILPLPVGGRTMKERLSRAGAVRRLARVLL